MKIANKELKDYWKIIKIAVFVLIGWSVFSLMIALVSFDLYTTIFSPVAGWILMIAVFGFIGWTAIKDHKTDVKTAAWSGAIAGAISGFIGSIIAIVMFNLVPEVILAAISQARPGIDASAMQDMMAVGMYIGLITGPLFSGIIGAILTSIAALIAKKV